MLEVIDHDPLEKLDDACPLSVMEDSDKVGEEAGITVVIPPGASVVNPASVLFNSETGYEFETLELKANRELVVIVGELLLLKRLNVDPDDNEMFLEDKLGDGVST